MNDLSSQDQRKYHIIAKKNKELKKDLKEIVQHTNVLLETEKYI